jgi:23S rRNA (cytidine1920-2'-O)/16S rRNA (cytidine1409-2'-O)-methyltransferase
MAASEDRPYVSRGGEKLQAALDGFGLDVAGWLCVDFGCNVGGFTDCLLRRGAAHVYALDTGYGELAWTLRKYGRVTVMERTNALYAPPPAEAAGKADLVVIDVAFTPQHLIVPATDQWLRPGGSIVSLLKTSYELEKMSPSRKPNIVIEFHQASQVCCQVCRHLDELGFVTLAAMVSPLRGKGGNVEFLLHLARKEL